VADDLEERGEEQAPRATAPMAARGRTIGVRRLVVLALVAAAAFVLALTRFGTPSGRDCSVPDGTDPSVRLQLEGPYRGGDGHPTYQLVVRRAGRVVRPAQVCLVALSGGWAVVVDGEPRAHVHLERVRRVS
jgi:hypothetical protein